MQALKALVIFMGVLIVAGMVLLVYGLMTRTGGGGEEAPETAGAGGGRLDSPFGEVEVAVPAGCAIADSELDGATLVIRLDGLAERGCQQVVIVDLAGGRELGRVKVLPGAPQ